MKKNADVTLMSCHWTLLYFIFRNYAITETDVLATLIVQLVYVQLSTVSVCYKDIF